MSNLIVKSIDDDYAITAYNHPLPYNVEAEVRTQIMFQNYVNRFFSILYKFRDGSSMIRSGGGGIICKDNDCMSRT